MAGYGLYLGKLQGQVLLHKRYRTTTLADNMVGRKPPGAASTGSQCPVEKRTGNPGNNKRQNAKTKN